MAQGANVLFLLARVARLLALTGVFTGLLACS
jgi:hypothetical protein